MASKAAAKRLAKEAALMEKDPPPFCYARPREDNVLEWHFILRGPPGTSYEGGEYWGQLLFPSDYPFKPPGIKVQTPSGRFCAGSENMYVYERLPSRQLEPRMVRRRYPGRSAVVHVHGRDDGRLGHGHASRAPIACSQVAFIQRGAAPLCAALSRLRRTRGAECAEYDAGCEASHTGNARVASPARGSSAAAVQLLEHRHHGHRRADMLVRSKAL